MKKFLILVASISVAFASILALAKPASALDQGSSITMSPLISRPTVIAGRTTDGEFTIYNGGSVDYTFHVYASPYSVHGLNYDQDYSSNTNFTQIARWITFDQTEYSLKSGESVAVPYHINAPASIPDGSQYAVIFAQTDAPESEAGGIQGASRVGMLVFAKGNGKTVESGSVADENIGFWHQSGPVTGTVQTENSGNTDFDASTHMEITNFFGGGLIAKTDNQTRTVLPETTFEMKNVWQSAPTVGLFWATDYVTFLGQTHSYKHLVLILPIWVIIAIIAILTLIVYLIVRKVKGTNHAKKKLSRR